jgi:hypothetical protein
MGNQCCVNEGHVIDVSDTISDCESVEDIIEILNNDMNLLRKIEGTIFLIKNKKIEILKKEDKIFLEYQVNLFNYLEIWRDRIRGEAIVYQEKYQIPR